MSPDRPLWKILALNGAGFLGCLSLGAAAFGFDALGIMVAMGQSRPWPGTYPFDDGKIAAKLHKHPQRPLFQHLWTY